MLRLVTNFPCFMMPTRVPASFARKRSCVAISTATPSALSPFNNSENSFAALGSRPDVGSQQERLRFLGERDADPNLLLHALRVSLDPTFGGIRPQSGPREELKKLLAAVVWPTCKRAEVLQVFQSRQVAIEHHRFRDVANVSLRLEWIACDITGPRASSGRWQLR